ncbi:MAG: hypothetical protein K0041_09550 [Acidithiobacillus sp.]|nr:hypothetical protein [Acidithiobacillus sp.]
MEIFLLSIAIVLGVSGLAWLFATLVLNPEKVVAILGFIMFGPFVLVYALLQWARRNFEYV